jgi:hypothetical protein
VIWTRCRPPRGRLMPAHRGARHRRTPRRAPSRCAGDRAAP